MQEERAKKAKSGKKNKKGPPAAGLYLTVLSSTPTQKEIT